MLLNKNDGRNKPQKIDTAPEKKIKKSKIYVCSNNKKKKKKKKKKKILNVNIDLNDRKN